MSNESSSKLSTAFQVFGILAVLVYFASLALSAGHYFLNNTKYSSGLSAFSYASHTNVDAAHLTLTNRGETTSWACVKGIVSSSSTGTKVESHVVCTGDVKPHSTTVLEAPYRVGSVLEICNKTGYADTKVVDWSKCTFEIVEVSAK